MRSARPAILISAVMISAAASIAGPAASASQVAGAPRVADAAHSPGRAAAVRATVAYPDLQLPDGRHALVYSDGLA